MKNKLLRTIKLISASYVLLLLMLLFNIPNSQAADASTPNVKWVPPTLQILDKIPGWDLKTSSISCEGSSDGRTVCKIPWISNMINSIYKYLLGAVGIIAAVAMMVGGLVWLTAGGNSGRVTQAKNIINGSIIGLVLAFSTYFILYQVNPSLTNLQPIRVTMINQAPDTSSKVTCNWIEAAICDANYGYTKGSNCIARPWCDRAEETPSAGSEECTKICCCVTSASSGCSWSKSATCDGNPGNVNEYSMCGTNTGDYTTCCCSSAEFATGKPYSSYKNIKFSDNAIIDMKNGAVSQGVLSMLESLDAAGFNLTVSTLKTGHSQYTSGGKISQHYSGQAFDLVGNAGELTRAAQWIYNNKANTNDLIYYPSGANTNPSWNLDNGVDFQFDNSTKSQHVNHIHWSAK